MRLNQNLHESCSRNYGRVRTCGLPKPDAALSTYPMNDECMPVRTLSQLRGQVRRSARCVWTRVYASAQFRARGCRHQHKSMYTHHFSYSSPPTRSREPSAGGQRATAKPRPAKAKMTRVPQRGRLAGPMATTMRWAQQRCCECARPRLKIPLSDRFLLSARCRARSRPHRC